MTRVAAFQMQARVGDVAANLGMIAGAAADAAHRGAAVLVAPELAVTGYGAGDLLRSLAEPADGPQVTALSALAAFHDISLVAGFAERDGDSLYNSALLVEPSGARYVYRKCHLYGAYEKSIFALGNRKPDVVPLGNLKAALLICYDVEFPEAVRHLASAGADIVLAPTALPAGPDAIFIAEYMVPVRAFENGIAIVYADHAGSDGRFTYAGRSCIAFPDGSVAARAAVDSAALIVADYDPAKSINARLANPYPSDRRADLFTTSSPTQETGSAVGEAPVNPRSGQS